jgi:hypothetical protein
MKITLSRIHKKGNMRRIYLKIQSLTISDNKRQGGRTPPTDETDMNGS